MNKAKIATGKLIKPRENPPKMLDLVDEAFDQMALPVPPVVVSPALFGPLMGRNDRLSLKVKHNLEKMACSIAPVSNQSLKVNAVNQGHRLGDIVALPPGQSQSQRIAQPINQHVYLGAKATTTAPQGLLSLPTTFFVPRPHRDGPARWCYRSSRFPGQDHCQNRPASVPRPLDRTSGRSVCKYCSRHRTLPVANAIGRRYGLSRARLQRSGDTLLRCQHRHSGLPAEIPESYPIGCLIISRLS